MPITQTTLLSGPAAATFGGHTFFANDGILVTPALEFEKAGDLVDSDANGALDATVSDAMVTIRFTPAAPFADLAALYPHVQGSPGASLFGSADAPLVLTAANGARLTFHAVAIVEMPDLVLTNRGPVAGSVTFLARGARGLGLTAANRLVTMDTGSIPLAPGGTPQLADDFAVTWGGAGSAPWVNLLRQHRHHQQGEHIAKIRSHRWHPPSPISPMRPLGPIASRIPSTTRLGIIEMKNIFMAGQGRFPRLC